MSESGAEAKIFNVVVGTAGHIDHGKSSLVNALTGQDPDRLKEEKERGLTIDLGYAELDLEGFRVGIIDVPGHERFVRNMVSGATGVDFVLLVVAADDGVMPQTREHLDIMQLLGIDKGVVVLSKIDLVEPDFLDLVEEDLREYLSGTFLGEAPIFRVSSQTGDGLQELRTHLKEALPTIQRESTTGVFRLPIQRSFSVKGFGTVVTGVPVSGTVSVGDMMEVLPGGHSGRVRGIQAYHVQTDSASTGQRAALNLTDVNYKEIGRGHVVVTPGFFEEVRLVELELHYLASNRRPLLNRAEVRLHAGTHDVAGRVSLLDRKVLSPGETCLAQIQVEEPVVVGPGDRFVIRLPSPSRTIGGGVVIGESERRLKRFRERVTDGLQRKLETIENKTEYLESLILEGGPVPVAPKQLALRAKLPLAEVERRLEKLEKKSRVRDLERNALFVHVQGVEQARELVVRELKRLGEENPVKMGHGRGEILKGVRLAPQLADVVFRELLADAALRTTPTGDYALTGHEVKLSASQRELMEKVDAAFREGAFSPPSAEELRESLGAAKKTLEQILDLMVQTGKLCRIKGGLLFHAERIEEACQVIAEAIQEKGELLATEFKDLVQTTRRYAIPLLEHLDDLGVTRRDGNRRLLTKEWEERMAQSEGA